MNNKLLFGLVGVLIASIAGGVWLAMSDVVKKNTSSTEISQLTKYAGKKVLYIDSYDEGYAWSDGVTRGVLSTLEGKGIEIKIFRMDTKVKNISEEAKKQVALEAKGAIEIFKPDVVIMSDDNAVKYVLKEYFSDSSMPFVYCGLNWDSSGYGLPYKNTTGMVEVALTQQLLDRLKQYAKGGRIGYLSADTETERKNLANYNSLLKLNFTKTYFVKSFEDWKVAFKKSQSEVDMLIFENNAGIVDWNDADAEKFALTNTTIPTGTLNDWVMKTVLIGYTKVPEEQGEFGAVTALALLGGAKISDIPEAKNIKGDLMLNMVVAKKLNLAFTPVMLRAAKNIIQDK